MKLRWSSPDEVRKSLARVNNMLLSREIIPQFARTVSNNAELILKCFELEEKKKARKELLEYGLNYRKVKVDPEEARAAFTNMNEIIMENSEDMIQLMQQGADFNIAYMMIKDRVSKQR